MCDIRFHSPSDLVGELGISLFEFSRHTITASTSIALLMLQGMNLPSEGGLGMRRLQWRCSPSNGPSMGLGKKMGFKAEGISRKSVRPSDPGKYPVRWAVWGVYSCQIWIRSRVQETYGSRALLATIG